MPVPEVDIIIVGAGSAGCVPAGRLANLDHNLQVLVIEVGEDNLNNPWSVAGTSHVVKQVLTDLGSTGQASIPRI